MTDSTTRRRRPRLAALAVALLLGAPLAAAGAGVGEEPPAKKVRSLLGLRHDRVAIQEWDLSCGAATVTTLLNQQFGDPVTEKEVATAMLARTDGELIRERLGFSLLDLKRELVHRGYRGEGYAGVSLEDLLGMVPAIVRLKNPGFDHFVIVRGTAHGRIVMADPAYGNKTMSVERFMAVWRDKIAFVAKRSDGTTTRGRLAVDPDEVPFVPPQAIRAALP
jgi:predicted double-glycine peptidase